MVLDAHLRKEIAQRIRTAAPDVEDVLLFGSHARGDAQPDSDVDLVVVVPESTHRRRCGRALQLALDGLGIGFDLVVLSSRELDALRDSPASMARTALRESRGLLDAA